MGDGMISVEVFCIVVLAVLLYSQLAMHVKEAEIKAFNICIVTCIIANAIDCSTYIISDYFPQFIYTRWYLIILSAAYSVAYIHCFFVFRYIGIIIDIKQGGGRALLSIFKALLIGFTIFTFITTFNGTLLIDNAAEIVPGPIYSAYIVMQVLLIVMQVAVLLMMKNKVENSIYGALFISVVTVSGVTSVGIYTIGADYVYPGYALTLMILHMLIQAKRVDLSQIEVTEEALSRAEQMNEMLHSANERLEEERRNIEAIAGMYLTMYMMDLENGTFKEIESTNRVRNFVHSRTTGSLQEVIWHVMVSVAREDYEDAVISFTNLSTLEERMKGRNAIYTDIINSYGQLWRLQFIRVGRLDEKLTKVIHTAQLLEEE